MWALNLFRLGKKVPRVATTQQQSSLNLGKKLGHFPQRMYTNGQWAHAKMFNITDHYQSANQSHKEIHFTSIKMTTISLFCGASDADGCLRRKLNISFPTTGCQKLIEMDNKWKPSYFPGEAYSHRGCCWRSGWRMEGYVVQISGGNDKQGFPMKCIFPVEMGKWKRMTCGWVCLQPGRGIPIPDQRGLEKESTDLHRDALWMPTMSSTWPSQKKGARRVFLGNWSTRASSPETREN